VYFWWRSDTVDFPKSQTDSDFSDWQNYRPPAVTVVIVDISMSVHVADIFCWGVINIDIEKTDIDPSLICKHVVQYSIEKRKHT